MPVAFVAAMLAEGGGARHMAAWESLLRHAIAAAAGTGLEEFPGVWTVRLAALDILLKPPLLQRAMVRILCVCVFVEM